VLTPEGMKYRLFLAQIYKITHAKRARTCTLGKPRAPRNVATIQMYGVSVDANDVIVYANFSEKALICAYMTKL